MHKSPVIVALDFADQTSALQMADQLDPALCRVKVGKELFTRTGPALVESLVQRGFDVFLDLKFHDIPNTVASACEAAAKQGVFMVNVHALGGKNMMVSAVQAIHKYAEEKKTPPTKIVGVTVLTSMTDPDLKEVGVHKNVKQEVEQLAVLAQHCGLDGVVASAQEIKIIRNKTDKKFLIVTPGVRPTWAAHGDQKRVMTPREAIQEGADYIVVGRPITQHPQPLVAAEKILKEIES